MDIRLIALDLDGTLLTTDKRLTEHTKKVLARAAEQGAAAIGFGGPARQKRPTQGPERDGGRHQPLVERVDGEFPAQQMQRAGDDTLVEAEQEPCDAGDSGYEVDHHLRLA